MYQIWILGLSWRYVFIKIIISLRTMHNKAWIASKCLISKWSLKIKWWFTCCYYFLLCLIWATILKNLECYSRWTPERHNVMWLGKLTEHWLNFRTWMFAEISELFVRVYIQWIFCFEKLKEKMNKTLYKEAL